MNREALQPWGPYRVAWFEVSNHEWCRSYPESNSDNQSTGDDTAERLVAGDLQPVWFDGVVERKVRHEEQNERRDNAFGDRPSKHKLVEQHVVMAGCVQLRITNRVRIVHVLRISSPIFLHYSHTHCCATLQQ